MECSACGNSETPGSRCSRCGAVVTVAPAGRVETASYTPTYLVRDILTTRSALDGERKSVTVLFCDIVQSTELAAGIGAESMHDVLKLFFTLLSTTVHRLDGTVNQFLGDGIMAIFGAPVTLENHAQRAIVAALEITGDCTARMRRDFGPKIGDFKLRVGINSGVAVVGTIGDNLRTDYTAVGETTHVAARLQSLADPGTILISDSTYAAQKQFARCVGPRLVELKGVTGKVAVYEVLELRGAAWSTEFVSSVPLVGRAAELAIVENALHELSGGQGTILNVSGDAGIGKTRFVAEARARANLESMRWLVGVSPSFGRILSYWPFIEMMRHLFGIEERDTEDTARTKLKRGLQAWLPAEVDELLPYLCVLLAIRVEEELSDRVKYLDGLALGHQVYRTCRRLFERLAGEMPLVLEFEDWHWADGSSIDLLQHLLPLVEQFPIAIVLVSRRSGTVDENPSMKLVHVQGYGEYLREITLNALTDDEISILAREFLGEGELSSALEDTLRERVGGSPLFLEETIRALIAFQAIQANRAPGVWELNAEHTLIELPATLHDLIMARIDRMDDDTRQVLKAASVVGRAFFYQLLDAIMERPDDLAARLSDLEHARLVMERRRIPELEYVFNHALIQQAIYESILASRRRHIHERVARALEQHYVWRGEELYPVLAFHYAQAEVWDKALEYLLKAGERAGSIAADDEALEYFRKAEQAYVKVFGNEWDPVVRARLALNVGDALFRSGQDQEATEQFIRGLGYLGTAYPLDARGVDRRIVAELVRHLGRWRPRSTISDAGRDEIRALKYQMFLSLALIDYYGEPTRFVLHVLAALNWAEAGGMKAQIAECYSGLGIICATLGLWRIAHRYHRRAGIAAADAGHAVAHALHRYGKGYHHFTTGAWQSATADFEQSIESFKRIGRVRELGISLVSLSWLTGWQGNMDRNRALIAEVGLLGSDTGDRHLTAWARLYSSVEFARNGQLGHAVKLASEACEMLMRVPDVVVYVDGQGRLADYYLRMGQAERAAAVIDNAEKWIRRKRLAGLPRVTPRLARAALLVACMQEADTQPLAATLRDARRACQRALAVGRSFIAGSSQAHALQAALYWLGGSKRRARRHWQKSLKFARDLASPYDEGISLREMGRLCEDEAALNAAIVCFETVGANFDIAKALRYVGELHVRHGRIEESIAAYRQALVLHDDMDADHERNLSRQGFERLRDASVPSLGC